MDYIVDRLKEPSTYVGIISVLGSLTAFKISPENAATIATGIATLAGAVLVFIKEHKS